MSNTTTKKRPKKCGECGHYKAMIYRESGEDAFCGRCMLPADRTRRVRSVTKTACDSFIEREGAAGGGSD